MFKKLKKKLIQREIENDFDHLKEDRDLSDS